ncbi:MAG: hypothetical protein M3014_10925 [Chloroflexota bacterium]|nr:hypothetical protein [Chloroflexota bacterium]
MRHDYEEVVVAGKYRHFAIQALLVIILSLGLALVQRPVAPELPATNVSSTGITGGNNKPSYPSEPTPIGVVSPDVTSGRNPLSQGQVTSSATPLTLSQLPLSTMTPMPEDGAGEMPSGTMVTTVEPQGVLPPATTSAGLATSAASAVPPTPDIMPPTAVPSTPDIVPPTAAPASTTPVTPQPSPVPALPVPAINITTADFNAAITRWAAQRVQEYIIVEDVLSSGGYSGTWKIRVRVDGKNVQVIGYQYLDAQGKAMRLPVPAGSQTLDFLRQHTIEGLAATVSSVLDGKQQGSYMATFDPNLGYPNHLEMLSLSQGSHATSYVTIRTLTILRKSSLGLPRTGANGSTQAGEAKDPLH